MRKKDFVESAKFRPLTACSELPCSVTVKLPTMHHDLNYGQHNEWGLIHFTGNIPSRKESEGLGKCKCIARTFQQKYKMRKFIFRNLGLCLQENWHLSMIFQPALNIMWSRRLKIVSNRFDLLQLYPALDCHLCPPAVSNRQTHKQALYKDKNIATHTKL